MNSSNEVSDICYMIMKTELQNISHWLSYMMLFFNHYTFIDINWDIIFKRTFQPLSQ